MSDQHTEGIPPEKQVSGIWVLLVFVVLLAAVAMVAIVAQ